MNLNFLPITPDDLTQYKRDMQEAFQFGAIEGGFPDEGEILPEKDIDRSLNKKGAAAFKVRVSENSCGTKLNAFIPK